MKKAISLLSGGLDSFISTAIARKRHKIVLALTFDYGQRAAKREISAAKKICRLWKIPHKVIKLPWLASITNTALVNRGSELPVACHPEGAEATEGSPALSYRDPSLALRMTARESARAVWVPNRNGIFINIAAGFAESLGAELIITGFNKEEAATFPDNSAKFVSLMNETLKYGTLRLANARSEQALKHESLKFGTLKRGTLNHPKVISYVQKMNKLQMVKYALRHRLPLEYCWPCYKGGRGLCRRCESCVRFLAALSTAGVE